MHQKNGYEQDLVDTHLPQHPIQKRKALIIELQGLVSPVKYIANDDVRTLDFKCERTSYIPVSRN
jgi:hypothetical protein